MQNDLALSAAGIAETVRRLSAIIAIGNTKYRK
jgi:hypothetical protein